MLCLKSKLEVAEKLHVGWGFLVEGQTLVQMKALEHQNETR
jgi:hypothetical protein